jgi:hypothetical protein
VKKDTSPALTRRELEALDLQPIHRARNWSKADVLCGEWPPHSGQRVIVKDIKNCPLWFRVLLGRFLMRREWNALRALNGVPGVPRALARPDADAIVIEYLPGTRVQKFPSRTLPIELLHKVEELVETLHARGVTHGDLHQKNILVDEEGQVALIDWATAQVFGTRRRNAAKERIFQELCALDRRAVAKLKCRHVPQMLTSQERDLLQNASRLYRSMKKLSLVFAALRGRAHYQKIRSGKKFQRNKFARRLAKHPSLGDNP